MKVSEMIKNLQDFLWENGNLECWYSADDEGNAYHRVNYIPSLYYVNEDDEVLQEEDLEYYELSKEDVQGICIVN